MAPDILYALHHFEAENVDELSFSAGEAIVVLERDDQYSDGWFQGRNMQGEVGLFPQSYTSPYPPTDSPAHSTSDLTHPQSVEPLSGLAQSAEGSHGTATLAPLRDTSDSVSLHSLASRRSSVGRARAGSDELDRMPEVGPDGFPLNPRAILAAKAAANAETAARVVRENAEERRKSDEAAYEKNRLLEGTPVEGLQMSDESDDEPISPVVPSTSSSAQDLARKAEMRAAIFNKGTTYSNGPLNGAAPVWSPSPAPATVFGPLPMLDEPEGDFMDNYLPGNDLSSSDMAASLSETVLRSSLSHDEPSVASIPVVSSPAVLEPVEEAAPAHVGGAIAVVAALGAAATGAFAYHQHTPAVQEVVAPAPVALLPQAEAVVHEQAATLPESVTAEPIHIPATSTVPTVEVVSPQSVKSRSLSPIDTSSKAVSPSLASLPAAILPTSVVSHHTVAHPLLSDSPAASIASRDSSQVGHDRLANTSVQTGETSPRGASEGAFSQKGETLPHDPREWDVAQVVEWGKGKGFDKLTLSKFQEHEISGDILIEMDVVMLKEIDLIAFGRRVHIFQAIKELKARVHPPEDEPTPMFSPSMSGYDPDSPGTMSFASPRQTSFSATPLQTPSLGGSPDPKAFSFAFAEPAAVTPRAALQASPLVSGHRRTGTAGTTESFNTADGTIDEGILEETDDGMPDLAVRPKGLNTRRPSTRDSLSSSFLSSRRSDMDLQELSAPPTPSGASKVKNAGKNFFSNTLNRARKPPPAVASGPFSESENSETQSNNSRTVKRSTRLFASFSSGSEARSPPLIASRRMTAGAIPSSPREGPSSMIEQQVDAVSPEMQQTQVAVVESGGNLLEKIGSADYSGWMSKRGEKFGWKMRFFVLKGVHLYYLKTESEQKVKGFINLSGYRVLADPDIHIGEFGFKIVHDVDRTHYFSAAEQVTVRTWMKEIMKATIGRDYSAPVVSSCNVSTIPLAVAQSMSPRPRPPSPASRARVQKERYAGSNPNTLSAKDAALLMESLDISAMSSPPTSPYIGGLSRGSSSQDGTISKAPFTNFQSFVSSSPPIVLPTVANSPLLQYVNQYLPPAEPRVTSFHSLRSGRSLTRLIETLSHTKSGITNAEFDKFAPRVGTFDAAYLDTVFAVFDAFATAGVSTEDISMDDLLSGNVEKLSELISRIQAKFSVQA